MGGCKMCINKLFIYGMYVKQIVWNLTHLKTFYFSKYKISTQCDILIVFVKINNTFVRGKRCNIYSSAWMTSYHTTVL